MRATDEAVEKLKVAFFQGIESHPACRLAWWREHKPGYPDKAALCLSCSTAYDRWWVAEESGEIEEEGTVITCEQAHYLTNAAVILATASKLAEDELRKLVETLRSVPALHPEEIEIKRKFNEVLLGVAQGLADARIKAQVVVKT